MSQAPIQKVDVIDDNTEQKPVVPHGDVDLEKEKISSIIDKEVLESQVEKDEKKTDHEKEVTKEENSSSVDEESFERVDNPNKESKVQNESKCTTGHSGETNDQDKTEEEVVKNVGDEKICIFNQYKREIIIVASVLSLIAAVGIVFKKRKVL